MSVPMNMTWPMPSLPAGCCPPGGMDALIQCYCDIQAATAFISKIVQDLAASDPAFQQALVDAIAASGSALPLVGVTNGANAQPGQVGEFLDFEVPFNVPTAAQVNLPLTMGVLPPGDWDVWANAATSVFVTSLEILQTPVPVGFNHGLGAVIGGTGGAELVTLPAAAVRALISVPTLIVINVSSNNDGPGNVAGTGVVAVFARRRR